jgi:hypothetical protein
MTKNKVKQKPTNKKVRRKSFLSDFLEWKNEWRTKSHAARDLAAKRKALRGK